MREVDLNLGWSMAWKATVGAFVLGGGGLALCLVCLIGVPVRDPGQRVVGATVGVVLFVVGVGALIGIRKYALRVRVSDDGLRIRRRDSEFALSWDEVERIGLTVEKGWTGRTRYRYYTLVFALAEDRSDLAEWRQSDEYRYTLGQAGRAGVRLDNELRRAGVRYTGLHEVLG